MPKFLPVADSSLDKIKKWVQDPETSRISESDKKIFDRLDFADTQLRRKPRKKEVANLIVAKYGITLRQAYNDIWSAQKLFGSVYPINKDWWRNWLIDDILLLIDSSKATKDLKSWASAQANLIKALALDQKDDPNVDPEILGKHNFYTVININNKTIKLNMQDFQKIPVSYRKKVIDALNIPIDESDAVEIMRS